MFEWGYTLPFWVTILFLIYFIYSATAGTDGAQKLFYKPGLIFAEVVVLAVLGYLFPKLLFTTIPPLNQLFKDTMTCTNVASIYFALGIPLSCLTWVIKSMSIKDSEDRDNSRSKY